MPLKPFPIANKGDGIAPAQSARSDAEKTKQQDVGNTYNSKMMKRGRSLYIWPLLSNKSVAAWKLSKTTMDFPRKCKYMTSPRSSHRLARQYTDVIHVPYILAQP